MSTSARTASGDMVVPRQIVTDFNTCVLQQIIDSLRLMLGEWFLDTSVGFPWLQRVFGVDPPPSAMEIAALLQQQLLSIEGVASVAAVANLNPVTRSFTYSFAAKLNSGATITGGSGQTFQINGSPSPTL